MKAVGEKCGWIIHPKERRILKLLRAHTRERDLEFVSQSPNVPRRQRTVRVQAEFGREELSAFQPVVRILSKPEALAEAKPKRGRG